VSRFLFNENKTKKVIHIIFRTVENLRNTKKGH